MKRFIFTAIALFALSAPALAQDAIDLHTVQIRNLPKDVADWKPTTSLTKVVFDRAGVTTVFSSNWPDITPPGWDGPLQYTVWLFVKDGEAWVGAGVVQMWRERGSTGGYEQPSLAQHLTQNWIRDGHWGITPTVNTGDTVGIMVTAGNQRVQDDHAVAERSNVVLVKVQDQAVYEFAAATPPPAVVTPPTTTPDAPPAVDTSVSTEQLKAILAKLDELKAQADANTEKIQKQIDQTKKDMEATAKNAVPMILKILSLGIAK